MANKKIDSERYNLPVTIKELGSFATTLFEFSTDAMLVLDAVGKISAINTALCNLIGDEKENIIGRIPDFLFAGQSDVSSYKNFIRDLISNGYWSGQVFGRNKSGAVIPLDLHFSAVYNELGEANHYVGICSSIYSYISQMNEISFDPNIDPLTKIYNANAFLHRLEHNIHKIEKDMSVLSLLYIDIDNFHELAKQDNYHAGDIILKNLGSTLKETLEESDTVARLKGDIFCVIIQDIYTQESIDEMVNKIFAKITKPYVLHPKIEKVSISIGVATFPISGETPQNLLASAASAAKEAKVKGGNQISYHKLLTDIE
ncbi:MAG: sensor domain-containing diguanylate cyclase [bacterium]|nr:sensor domain-containing diguanylate cyclase [bacterium]